MTVHTIAPDDIVRRWDDVRPDAREPLVVLDPLLAFLDGHDLGEGEAELEPIGEGHSNVTYAVARGGRRFVLRRPRGGRAPTTCCAKRGCCGRCTAARACRKCWRCATTPP